MKAQEMILFLAEYIDRELDPETVSVLDRELSYYPKAALFLMDYRHTLLFYKRHHHDEKLGWMVEYLDQRIPRSLRVLVEDLSYKGLQRLVTKDESTS